MRTVFLFVNLYKILFLRCPTYYLKELGVKASSICGKLKTPTKADAKVISGLFPSTSSGRKRPGATVQFVPHTRNKTKRPPVRFKPSKITAILVANPQRGIPKGRDRKRLKKDGDEKVVELKRNMSSAEVKNCLLRAFQLEDYLVLKSTQDGKLTVAVEQHPSGDDVIENITKRKFPLYICKGSAGEEGGSLLESPSATIARADVVLSALKATPGPSSPRRTRSTVRPIEVLSSDEEDLAFAAKKPLVDADLQESRQIRAEQDIQYQESLRIDQEKEAQRAAALANSQKELDVQEAAEAKKAAVLQRARDILQSKFESDDVLGDVQISFRLPSGAKLEHGFVQSSSTQVLYEFVFLRGHVDEPFTILQVHPRQEILLSRITTIESLQLGSACVLVVIEKDNSPNLLSCLEIEEGLDCLSDSTDQKGAGADDPQPVGNQDFENDVIVVPRAEPLRLKFVTETFSLPSVPPVCVRRSHLFDDVMELYASKPILFEYPFRIKFADELARDCGGVSRDMLSGFWEVAYLKYFDGCRLLTPVMHPQVEVEVLSVIGRILSHGYLTSNFLPVRIAFPTLACLLLGPTVAISDAVLLEVFPDALSEYEAEIVRQCLGHTHIEPSLRVKLLDALSRFGCREMPSSNIKSTLAKVARYEFIAKPLAAVSVIHSGIPALHAEYWSRLTVEDLRELYLSLTASPGKVLDILESCPKDQNEDRVFKYLKLYIGGMTRDKVQKFLRFTTGSSVCMTPKLSVEFNSLSGFSRRPIGHTCACMLELPSSYLTYLDLETEFDSVLTQPEIAWSMDSV